MADFDPLVSGHEGNFDNDFEKLDPLSSGTQEETVSSTQDGQQESSYSNQLADIGNEAEATGKLIDDLDPSPSTVLEPTPQPETPKTTPLKSANQESAKESSKTCWVKSIDPRDGSDIVPHQVIDLIYWRDVKKTGVVFGSAFVLLLSLALFSVLSVLAYLSLALLTVTISFVVYKKIMAAVQKTTEGHPFKQYLEVEVSLPEDKLHQLAENAMKYLAQSSRELRRLFLVEDLVDSLKPKLSTSKYEGRANIQSDGRKYQLFATLCSFFGLMLWVLTYIGAWFNGMTLLILGLIGIFSIPKFYETYQVQIDANIDLIKGHVTKVVSQVKEKLPLPGKAKKE